MTDCLFCKIASGEIPAKSVYTDDLCVAFHDVNPQAPTHILIIPRHHIADTNELKRGDAGLVGHMVVVARQVAEDFGLAEVGYRLVLNCGEGAGQSVFHIHLHLLGGRKFGWPPG